MGLFFFISAYFIVPSYNKKGAAVFIKDRIIRLFIPLCIFYFVLHPTTDYFAEKAYNICSISYLQYMYNSIINIDNVGFGPLWFVEALLIFSGVYVLFRIIFKEKVCVKAEFPDKKGIFAFMIILGIISFIVRIFFHTGEEIFGMQLGYFPQYILKFLIVFTGTCVICFAISHYVLRKIPILRKIF